MNKEIVRHSPWHSIVLHLLPGLLVGLCYFAIVPVVKSYGFPSVMALSVAAIFVLIPFELGFLFYQKRKTGGRLFGDVIRYLKPLSKGQYLLWIVIIIILTAAAFMASGFAADMLMPLFSWLPSDMFLNMGLDGEYSRQTLIITYSVFFVFIVLVAPAVEELYFRGYLLPRMPVKNNELSALSHSALFALYHTWTPWLFITRTLGVLPLIYIVKRKKNIYTGIVAHCVINSIDFFIAVAFISSI